MDRIASFNLILFLCMATVLGLALVSKALSNRFIGSEPMFAVAAGAVFGPHVLGWVNRRRSDQAISRFCSNNCLG